MYIRRKVYSVVDDNLYNVEDTYLNQPEEQLYSVNMTEDEARLFSDFMEGYYESLYADTSANEYYLRQAAGYGHEVDPKTGKVVKKVAQVNKNPKLSDADRKMYEEMFKDAEQGDFDKLTKAEKKTRRQSGPNDGPRQAFTEAEQKANAKAGRSVKKMNKKEWDALHTAEMKAEATKGVRHLRDLEKTAMDRGHAAGHAEGLALGRSQGAAVARRAKEAGREAGLEAATIRRAIGNTWRRGKGGKAGLIAAGAAGTVGAGLAGYGAYKAIKD